MLDYIRSAFTFKKSFAHKMLYRRSYLSEKDLLKLQKIIFDLAKSLNVPAQALDITKIHVHPTHQMSVATRFDTKRNIKKNRLYKKPIRYVIRLKELDAQILLGAKYEEDKIYEAFKSKDIKTLQKEIDPKKALKTINKYRTYSYRYKTPDEIKAGLAHEFGHIVKYWQDFGRKNFKFNFIKSFLLLHLDRCLLFGRLQIKYLKEHENFADDFVHLNPTLRRAHHEYFKNIVDVEKAGKSLYFASIKTKLYPIRKLYKLRYDLDEKIHSMKLWIRDPHRSNRKRAALAKI